MSVHTKRQGGFAALAAIFPGLVLLGMLSLGTGANAQTDLTDLSLPAIAVKAPSRVFLDAIARAGDRLVAVGEHGVIIYSDDNGRSWHQAQVPVDVLLTAVAFATPLDGWAAGHFGVILHTEDGGLTWQKQLDGVGVNELAVRAAQVAQAANLNLPAVPLADKRAAKFLADGPDRPFLAILAMSAKEAIVVGAYRLADRTADGGRTWQDMSLVVGDAFSHNLYAITQAGSNLYIAGETGLVFRSTDNGQTFPQVTLPAAGTASAEVSASDTDTTPYTAATLFGILGAPDGSLFTYGVAGQAFHSKDNGTTWQPVALGTSANLTAAIVLKSGAILLATQYGTLYLSTDEGQSFKPMSQIVPLALAGMVQARNGSVVMVGIGGAVSLPAADFAQSK